MSDQKQDFYLTLPPSALESFRKLERRMTESIAERHKSGISEMIGKFSNEKTISDNRRPQNQTHKPKYKFHK